MVTCCIDPVRRPWPGLTHTGYAWVPLHHRSRSHRLPPQQHSFPLLHTRSDAHLHVPMPGYSLGSPCKMPPALAHHNQSNPPTTPPIPMSFHLAAWRPYSQASRRAIHTCSPARHGGTSLIPALQLQVTRIKNARRCATPPPLLPAQPTRTTPPYAKQRYDTHHCSPPFLPITLALLPAFPGPLANWLAV